MSGNYIIWEDWRNGACDVYMYNLSTGTEYPVLFNPMGMECGYNYYIEGNRIVYDKFNNGREICLGMFDVTPPVGTVNINNGNAYTSSPFVTLTLSATDQESGMGDRAYMKISNTNPANWDTITTLPYSNTYSWTLTSGNGTKTVYTRFMDAAGNWSTAVSDNIILSVLDATPPTVPVVTDGGAYTVITTQLCAAWSSSDPESGIVEYQYAIGTTVGGNNIVNWTSTGATASVTKTGLNLTSGITYYFSVKANNGARLWSAAGNSDGIKVDTTLPALPVVTDDGATTTL
ncbi:MAG: hypothetical protein V1933_08715 [Candidatus Omnitrophota bacterium]